MKKINPPEGKKKFRVCYGKKYRRRDKKLTKPVKHSKGFSSYWKTHPYYAETLDGRWASYTKEGFEAPLVNGKPAIETPMDLVSEYKPKSPTPKPSRRK